jgi:Tfp pilus assembly protein PilX
MGARGRPAGTRIGGGLATDTLQDQRGSMLLLSLVLVSIMTLLGAALFEVTVVEHRLVMSDQQSAQAFHAAEGGLYRAYLDLGTSGGANAFATVFAGAASQTLYTNQAFAGAGFTVIAAPVTGSVPNKITLTASGCYPAADPCPTTNSSAYLRAAVSQQLLVPHGIFAGTSVSFASGSSGGFTDSYDSSQGAYNAATAGKNAGVTSNGTISLTRFTVNGNVLGTTNTASAPDVTVASSATVNGNVTSGGTVTNSGTVTGTITQNSPSGLVTYPLVAPCGPPYSSGAGMTWTGTANYNAATGALVVNGSSNTLTLANGSYCFSSVTLSSSGTLKVTGAVVIRMTGKADFSGGTVTNTTLSAEKLQILSSSTLATCSNTSTTGITLSTASATHALVYAPAAGVTLKGTSAELFGSVIANTLCIPSGSPNIHYDAQLSKSTILQAGQATFPMNAWQRCLNASCT